MATTDAKPGVPATHKVKIKIRAFPYYVPATDPVTNRDYLEEKIAVRGDEVDLSETDYQRALKFDAIALPTTPEQEGPIDVANNIEVASIEEVSEWLRASKPTIDETVAAAEDDPIKARKLLDAENLVSGRQPRAGVVTGLEKIIRGEGDEPPS
jgi:hypothetical protein